MNTRITLRRPTHPGELLDDVIPSAGKTKEEIASLICVSNRHFYDILAGRRPISPDIAARLGTIFGDGAEIWLRMQAKYDEWHNIK